VIKDYIHKFGGNPADVTVFGESAGGGIIMHSITAYGSARDPPLFQKVVKAADNILTISRQSCNLQVSYQSGEICRPGMRSS
jgi:carboxylesterase type B